jgi:hypothetical protein
MSGFRKLLLGMLLCASVWGVMPTSAKADAYWDNHWGWYDRTYRPYYTRRYYVAPPTTTYYYGAPAPAPYYGGTYYYGPSYGYGYPYGTYYGGGVQVGPLRFGWW